MASFPTFGGLPPSAFGLSAIKELTDRAKKSASVDDLMNLLLERSMVVTGAKIGSVLMVEPNYRQAALIASEEQIRTAPTDKLAFHHFRVAAAKGHDVELKRDSYVSIGDSVSKTVLLEKKPLLILDIAQDPRTLKSNDPRYGPPSFLSMPIFIGDHVSGVLNLANKETGQLFDGDDEQMLSTMFEMISFALENTVLHSKIEDQLRALKEQNIKLEKENTERRRAEETLIRREALYRFLVENSDDIIYTTDLSGCFIYVNPVAERIIGIPRAELVGRYYFSLVRPDFHEEMKALYRKQLAERLPSTYFEFPVIARDGSTKWIGQIVQCLMEEGNMTGFHAVARDITDRKKTEEALVQERLLLNAVVDTLPGIFYAIDEQGYFIRWNKNGEIITGYSAEEAASMQALEMIAEEHRALITGKIQEVLAGGHATAGANLLTKTGRKLPYHLTATRVVIKDRIYLFGTAMGIDECRRAEEALRKIEEPPGK